MIVHRDPFEFLVLGASGKASHSKGANVFAMFDENSEHRMSEIMALNPHIHEIHMVPSHNQAEKERERSFAQKLKTRFNPFDILVKKLSMTDLSHDRGRGPHIGM